MKYTGEYDDIINLPHHISKKYPQMSLESRAAQFAPFAALVGYDEEVKETARFTSKRIEIDDELKLVLDRKLKTIKNHINPLVSLTYFIPDLKKEGGMYITITGKVKKIDEFKKNIILEDKTEVPISEIIDINLEP